MRRRLGRVGLRVRTRLVRAAVRRGGHHLRGSGQRHHPSARRQDHREAAGGARERPGSSLGRWPGRHRRGRSRAGGAARVPRRPQGDGWWRRARDPRRQNAERPGGGPCVGAQRGRAGVRRSDGLPRALHRGSPSCRGADPRGLLRDVLGRRRTRLQHPATQPEGDRGVSLHRPGPRHRGRDQGGCRTPVGRGGVPQRRHGGVPRRARHAGVLLHGGQCPASGRAPRHRGDHRSRPGHAAAAGGTGISVGGRAPVASRPRHRGAPVRGGP